MKFTRNQSGSIALVALLVLIVVAVVGLVLLNVNRVQQAHTDTSVQSRVATDVPAAPAVNNTKDLDSAEKVLDQTNPDSSMDDSAQLDEQLTGF